MTDVQRPEKTKGVPLRENPVLRRELIERVRGFKVVVFITLWLALLTGILLLAYQGTVALSSFDTINVARLGRVGRELFEWVLFGMLVLIMFFVPGLTAGAITGERERQTLVPLQMTMMRPRDIIVGKLSAALAFLVLLVITAAPLLAVSFLVGGIRLLDVFRGIAMLLFTGLVLGAVCVWLSSRLRRTTAATVLAYGVTFLFAVGSFAGLLGYAIIDASRGFDTVDPPAELLSMNPAAAIADVLPRTGLNQFGADETVSPFGGLRLAIDELGRADEDFLDVEDEVFVGDEPDFDELLRERRGPRVWIYYTVIGLLVLVAAVRDSAKQVSTPADSER